jgi:non-ribosomal peptide synthetase component F
MVDDAQISVLVSQGGLFSANGVTTVLLDTECDAISQHSTDNITDAERAIPLTSDHLAYVIYTSGSTGKPKGTLITHANVSRLMQSTDDWFGFSQDDVWTLFHSYAFDFSVWEIWGALFFGGRLVVVPFETSRSPVQFYQLLCHEGVTVLNQTPSAFYQLDRVEAEQGMNSELALRTVIFGGEALELWRLQDWFDRHGDQSPQLVNMYGITETTVHVTYQVITQEHAQGRVQQSLIGCPIPDLQAYVVDAHQQLVPHTVQ